MSAPPRTATAKSAPCPICGKPAHAGFVPFCSARCADVDLGRWLGERYALPGPPEEPGEFDDVDRIRERRGEAGQG